MKKILFSLLVCSFLSSCVITNEYTFNKDFSCKMDYTFDASAVLKDYQDQQTVDIIQNILDSLQGEYKNNIKVDDISVRDGKFSYRYTFSGLNDLNNFEAKGNPQFSLSGNTLYIKYPSSESDSMMTKLKEYDNDVISVLIFKQIFKFPKKIKSVEYENYQLSDGNKTLTVEAPINKIMDSEIVINFK